MGPSARCLRHALSARPQIPSLSVRSTVPGCPSAASLLPPGGCGISSYLVTCLFQLLCRTPPPSRLLLLPRPQGFTSQTVLGRLKQAPL